MKNFVCVDLGSSETRYANQNAVVNEDNVLFLSNQYVDVPLDANIIIEGADDVVENNLDITIKKDVATRGDVYPRRILMGYAAQTSATQLQSPEALKSKEEQRCSIDSIIVACALSKLKGEINDDPISLFLALPPLDVSITREDSSFSERVLGNYEVTFNRIEKTVSFRIDSLNISDEPFMALTTFFMDTEGYYREDVEEYRDGVVMMIDIGNSTTDIARTMNGRYVNTGSRTYKIGCATMSSKIKDAYNVRMRRPLKSESMVNQILREGRTKVGGHYEMFDNELIEAKRFVAEGIAESLRDYYNDEQITPDECVAVVISGGGSMPSSYTDATGVHITAQSIAEYVSKAIKGYTANVPILKVPGNPRTAVIRGLVSKAYVLCKDN